MTSSENITIPPTIGFDWRGRVRAAWRRVMAGGRLPALVCLGALLALRAWDPGPVETLRLNTFDLFQLWLPAEPALGPVVIVDIDERSLAEVGQWPWPRTDLAQMVANLQRMGAVVIGFDVVLAEADRMSAPVIAERLRGLDDETRAKLRAIPSNDSVLADVMSRARVVLAQGTHNAAADSADVIRRSPPIFVGGNPVPSLLGFPGTTPLVHELAAAAMGTGVISLIPERDGIIRRMPAVVRIGDVVTPGLAVEMLRVATGQKNFAVKSENGSPEAVVVARVAIPIDSGGRIWLRASRHDERRFVAAHEVLSGSVDPARIKGKLVLIGTSASGLGDIRTTAAEPFIPGVEVQAQLLESIIAQQVLLRPSFLPQIEWLGAAVIGLLPIIVAPWLGAILTLLAAVLLALAVAGGTVYALESYAYLIDPSFPVLALAVLYIVLVSARFASEERGRRQIRQTFGRYVSPHLVRQLAEHPEQVRLGGERRTMTFLFCDVRGFTTISEEFRDDPSGLTTLINRFLTPMTDAVLRHSGTVDKYIGDSIMAFWNAPLEDSAHPAHACEAALAMFDALGELNEELRREALDGTQDAAHSGADLDQDHRPIELLQRDAEQGYANAQYGLGKAYRDGIGVERDPARAVHWFATAAQQGYPKAQRALGMRYLHGEGVTADRVVALTWLTLAAGQGIAVAEDARQTLAGEMPQSDKVKADYEARTFKPHISGRRAFRLEMGIGLNTGECVVGNMGSDQRFDYSVLGDAVNLASRLEAQSKNYGVGIVISEETRALVPDLATLELDLIAVKGKRQAIRVHGLIGDRDMARSELFTRHQAVHSEMIAAYQGQRWQEAADLIARCRELDDSFDDFYDLYQRRVELYRGDSPGPGWDGVFVARAK